MNTRLYPYEIATHDPEILFLHGLEKALGKGLLRKARELIQERRKFVLDNRIEK